MHITGASLGIASVVAAWSLSTAAYAEQTGATLPLAQQSEIVQKYCAVCHSNAKRMGGLSLEHFDAAQPDPNVAGMMVSKLDGGAMGAAGIKQPARMTVAALRSALAAQAIGAQTAAGGWMVRSFNDPTTKRPLVTASMTQEVALPAPAGQSGSYDLTITCEKTSDLAKGGTASGPAEMRLATYVRKGPDAPLRGRQMLGSVGRSVPFEVDGRSVGAAVQYVRQDDVVAATFVMPLPSHTLTIRNLFPGETVNFPFGQLTATVREVLSTCVAGTGAGL